MPSIRLRASRKQDNDALIALEKRSPLVVGEIELAFDRSPDYYAGSRLQERSQYVLAEQDGRLVGVCASAVHPATVMGRERLLAYTHHERIDPKFQRHGFGRALPRWLGQRWLAAGIDYDRTYAYIDSKNAASLAFSASRGGPGPWPVDAWLQDLPANASDPGVHTEPVGPADIDEVVALVNATHGGLELFPIYTPQFLRSRLSRSPQYGWAQWHGLRRDGRLIAAAGVFDQGANVAAIARPRGGGPETISRSLVVLDYGYARGEVQAMMNLLDCLRHLAAASDRQSLEISVPESRPLYGPVMDQASNHIRFKFLGGIPRPHANDHIKGVYIDPVYL